MIVLPHRRKAFRGGGFDKTSLELWCDFDGDGDDDSGNHTLTESGTMTYVDDPWSVASSAVRFKTSPDRYFTVPDAAGLTPSGDLSLVCWQKGDTSGTNYFFCKWNPAPQKSYFFYWASNGTVAHARSDDGTNDETEGTTGFTSGTWYHAAFVYTHSSNTVEYFRDGSSVASDTFTVETGTLHDGTSTLYIGSLNGTDSSTNDVCRLSFWGRALSSDEVSDLYNSGNDKKYADL